MSVRHYPLRPLQLYEGVETRSDNFAAEVAGYMK